MSEMTAGEIAQNLDVADEKAKYDASARKLVAQKSILAYILMQVQIQELQTG